MLYCHIWSELQNAQFDFQIEIINWNSQDNKEENPRIETETLIFHQIWLVKRKITDKAGKKKKKRKICENLSQRGQRERWTVSSHKERWTVSSRKEWWMARSRERWALAKNGERRALVNGELSQRTPRQRKQWSASCREEWSTRDDQSLVSEVRRREVVGGWSRKSHIFDVEKMGRGRERARIENEEGLTPSKKGYFRHCS